MENQNVLTNTPIGAPESNKVKTNRRFSKFHLIIFAVIFAVIGAAIIIRSMAATPAACTTLYSQTSGDLSALVNQSPDGSVICLKAGNYNWNSQTVVSKNSETVLTAGSGYSAADVKISDQATGSGIYITPNSKNITFNSVTINGATVGSKSGNASKIQFINVVFKNPVCINTGDPAITGYQYALNITIDHSLFDNIAYGTNKTNGCSSQDGRLTIDGNTVQGGRTAISNVVISNNVFNGSGPTNDTCTDGIYVTGGAFGTAITGNEFKNMNNSSCTNLHAEPIQFYLAARSSVIGNYFHDNWGGIMAKDGTNKQYTDLDIRNNVFVYNGTAGTSPAQITIGGGLGDVIDHNVFAGGSLVRIARPDSSWANTTYEVISNNVFTSGSSIYIDPLVSPTTNTVRNNLASTTATAGTGGTVGSPNFVSTTPTNHNDYILKAGTLGTGIAVNQTTYPNFLGADLGVFSISDIKPGPAPNNITGPGKVYLSPPSTNVQRDSEISVTVREDSGSTTVNAVAAKINYPADLLDFVSIDTTGSAFGISAVNNGGNGSIDIQRGSTTAISGDRLVATIKFHIKDTTGTATIKFTQGTALLNSTTNTDLLGSLANTTGATYTIIGTAKQWAGFTQTNGAGPGTTYDSPSAASPAQDRVDLFVRKSDSTVWQTTSINDKWSGTWTKVPNAKTNNPVTSISTKTGTIDIFYTGTDNLIRTQTWNGSNWSSPIKIGSQTTNANPGVVLTSSSQVDLFATGLDGKVYRTTKSGNTWGGWSVVNGIISAKGLTTAPVSQKTNNIDLFFVGSDYKVYSTSWNGNSWSNAIKIDDRNTYSGPVAVSRQNNYEDIFIRGQDNAIYQKSWNGYTGKWSDWQSRGGNASVRAAVTSHGPGKMFLFITLSNGSVQDNSYQ